MYESNPMQRAVAALPGATATGAKQFIANIERGAALILPDPIRLLEFSKSDLGNILTELISADLIRRNPKSEQPDLPSFIAKAVKASEPLTKVFLRTFPDKHHRLVQSNVESAALGFVGLHGILLYPASFDETMTDNSHGADDFKKATAAFSDRILSPMAEQLR